MEKTNNNKTDWFEHGQIATDKIVAPSGHIVTRFRIVSNLSLDGYSDSLAATHRPTKGLKPFHSQSDFNSIPSSD